MFFVETEVRFYDGRQSPFVANFHRDTETVKRIFLTLAILASCLLFLNIVLGLNIGDAKSLDKGTQSQINVHLLVGLGALTFSTLIHAISLTYFMGTGRWLEETSNAYSLGNSWYNESQRIKYQTLPGMTCCIGLLIATGALGAVADPATPMSLDGFLGMTSSQWHFLCAVLTTIANVLTNVTQYAAISKHSGVVESVLGEVRRIREERGLPT